MLKCNVHNVQAGDWIILKYNLGEGKITRVLMEKPDPPDVSVPDGNFPMIQYLTSVLENKHWCTYIVVDRIIAGGIPDPSPRLHLSLVDSEIPT